MVPAVEPTKTQLARERRLMVAIHSQHGPLITTQCALSSISPSFIAALIANESGGERTVTRFEPAVFQRFLDVQHGKRPSYAGYTREKVEGKDTTSLRRLATSWGLTQIMGYHAPRFGLEPIDLLVPERSIHTTLRLLAEFAGSNGLDLSADYEELLRCWNSGSPTGKAHDPDYVGKAILRMKLYEEVYG